MLAVASFSAAVLWSLHSGEDPSYNSPGLLILLPLEVSFLGLCMVRRRRSQRLRAQWMLLMFAALLRISTYAVSVLGSSTARLIPAAPEWAVTYTNLFSLFALIPFVLLVSRPSGQVYPLLFGAIDTGQAFAVGFLAYISLFKDIAFTIPHAVPSAAVVARVYAHLSLFYGSVAVFLAVAATLRWFASTGKDESRFYRVQAICATVSLMLSLLSYVHPTHDVGWEDALGYAPVLLSCWLITRLPSETEAQLAPQAKRFSTWALNLASPLFFSFSLFGLGVFVARNRFYLGIAFAAAAIVLYGMRSSYLQLHFQMVQDSLWEARNRLEALSLTDGLTGVANRRSFDLALAREWRRAVREESLLSLVFIDIDYFKLLNDRDGHARGDECLRRVAGALQACVTRSTDLFARYGGEEFAVLLPGTDDAGAEQTAKHMHATIHKLCFPHITPSGPCVTISVGVATREGAFGVQEASLVEAADEALYEAKRLGRNRSAFAVNLEQDTHPRGTPFNNLHSAEQQNRYRPRG